MQPRFAAVLARPGGLRPDQPHSCPVRIVVHLPRRGEEHLDVFVREEIGRPMRPVDHADLPLVRVLSGTGLLACLARRLAQMQHVAGAQHTAGVAAEAPQDESALAAEIFGHLDAASDREICPAARALRAAEFEQRSRGHRHRLPARHRYAIQARAEIRAGDRDGGVARDTQRGAHHRNLQSRRTLVISHQSIGGAERQIVHRTGRRHADMPVTQPSRIVLHGGLHAGLDDVDGAAAIVEAAQVRRRDAALFERCIGGHLAKVLEIGLDAVDAALRQRGVHASQRRRAIFAVHDDLGQHGVVVRSDLRARFHPGLDARAGRPRDQRETSRARLKFLGGIFGIQTHLDRTTARPNREACRAAASRPRPAAPSIPPGRCR